MIKKVENNKKAIIVLHEIYGINRFMEDVCAEYHQLGFDIYCPDMLKRTCFSYTQAFEAYDYFKNEAGFDFYKNIEQLMKELKLKYDKVFLLGFSAGATIAWRCCENINCDGIICCYGSRIRDYMLLKPCCQVLLLFAEKDSFDVERVIIKLQEKPGVEIHKFKACHGFMDPYSQYFNKEQALISNYSVCRFLHLCNSKHFYTGW